MLTLALAANGRVSDLACPAKWPCNRAGQVSLFQLKLTRHEAKGDQVLTMSLEMCFWLVTDEQLSSFRRRHGAFFAFSQSAPFEVGVVDDHRNVVRFHFLLNGTKGGAIGPLRIFETWFRPYRCADLLIDDSVSDMDPFGINAADTRALLERLKALPKSEIRARERLYIEMRLRRERQWRWFRRARTPTIGALDEDAVYLEECFANLREICEHAVARNCGLIWAPG